MLSHIGHCSASDSVTTIGIGTLLGFVLFRPWRKARSTMSTSTKVGRWMLPAFLASAVTLGACGSDSGSSAPRPSTAARLEIVQPTPNATMPPNFTLELNLIGAKVVPEQVTGGTLRGDEGHIHVNLDGKLISMTFGTKQDLKDIAPGPHNLQAEFVAADHAPFSNRVIVAVAFAVAAPSPAPGAAP